MDNSEKIRQYIKNNPGTTEYKIAIHTVENHICARGTAHNIIYKKLIPNGKIIDRKIGNSFHRFYINNKNAFNNIASMIDELVQIIKSITDSFLDPITKLAGKNVRELLELTKLEQLYGYAALGAIGSDINSSIQDREDKETLNFRLVNILVLLNKLSTITLPSEKSVFDGVKMRKEKMVEDKKIFDNYLPKLKKMRKQKKLSRSDLIEIHKIERNVSAILKDIL